MEARDFMEGLGPGWEVVRGPGGPWKRENQQATKITVSTSIIEASGESIYFGYAIGDVRYDGPIRFPGGVSTAYEGFPASARAVPASVWGLSLDRS